MFMGSANIADNLVGKRIRRSAPMGSEYITIEHLLKNTEPQTAANFTTCFFIAPTAMELVEITERHETAGSDGSAVTTMLKKVASGTAPASGTDMLSAGINMKAIANTNQNGSLHATLANRQLAAGDALALVLTGTPTALVGVSVRVKLKYIA
jgi:hypothetical protein